MPKMLPFVHGTNIAMAISAYGTLCTSYLKSNIPT